MKLKSITVSSNDDSMINKYTMRDGIIYMQGMPSPAFNYRLGAEIVAVNQSFDKMLAMLEPQGWKLVSKEEETTDVEA